MTDAWTYNPHPPRPDWGVRAPALKLAATRRAIVIAPPPDEVVLSLAHSAVAEAEPLVRIAERVRTGQVIGRDRTGTALHASITGVVTAIEARPVPAREPRTALCVVLRRDGAETLHPDCQPLADPFALSPVELRERIADGGIVGLGGAMFPTAVKLATGTAVEALLLNGAECEPWIACDEMLLRERAAVVIDGAQIMMHALGAAHAVVAVEADMPEARVALHDAIGATGDDRIGIAVVTAKYPAGGERQLIELVAGREVPAGGLPRDVGYLCQNVGTAAAVAELCRQGRPLIARIVTMTGGAVRGPGNFEVRLGTRIAELVALAGGYREPPRRLLMGGPMMGYALPDDDLPVIKATNCIVAATAREVAPSRPELPCIRCGDCVQVCPARLLPQELNAAALLDDPARLQEFGLFDCIECGCCDYVCPSNIPLMERFIAAKAAERERRDTRAERQR